ncbi:anthranilate synthase component I [Halobellus salinus]|uniref:Anthranilate synthase component 1 n=1 Tax=Halobellus salinus TaxID=931585 RepID=A0A830EMF1_9EURY|nr:anthranilate synthase component I [Halobellus salinus]GGI98115.1 anthranilate synthase component I [Halobellus salinus]SMP06601.1 anthranilate synthase, component I [Halobellus salinus]
MTDLSQSRPAFVDEVGDAAAEGPVVAHVTAAMPEVTPLAAYAALAGRSDYGFLLESAEKTPSSDPAGAFAPDHATADRHARFSFVGYDPDAVVRVGPAGTEVERLDGRAAAYVETPAAGGGVGSDSADGADGATSATSADGAADPDVLDRLRAAFPDLPRVGFPDDDRQQLRGGLVGFLAYEAVYDLWLSDVGVDRPDTDTPDAEFVLTTKTLSVDHADGSVSLVLTPVVAPDDDPGAVYDDLRAEARRVADVLDAADAPDPDGFVRSGESAGTTADYEAAVRETKRHVLDGDIYQGVISRVRELRGEVDPVGLYEALRAVNPSPYMYLLRHDGRHVVGASPETLVSVTGDRVVSNPIAGTSARGSSPVEDRRLAGELLADGKERAEHTMLVDLARNDVRRVSEPGSVRVEEFMNVLKYSHVQHIESTVTGTLASADDGVGTGRERSAADAFDATRATFPAGTLTGAPKVRAMEIVDDLEPVPRGVYGGGVGYYSWSGDADVAIVIRTATVDRSGDTDTISVQAGAGIVADSDPTAEYEETEQKMHGVLAAIDRIERPSGDPDTEPDDDPDTEEVVR